MLNPVPEDIAQVLVYVTALVVFGESKVENETGMLISTVPPSKFAPLHCGVSLTEYILVPFLFIFFVYLFFGARKLFLKLLNVIRLL